MNNYEKKTGSCEKKFLVSYEKDPSKYQRQYNINHYIRRSFTKRREQIHVKPYFWHVYTTPCPLSTSVSLFSDIWLSGTRRVQRRIMIYVWQPENEPRVLINCWSTGSFGLAGGIK